MPRAETNAVKRYAYEDGITVNKWLQAIIRQALTARSERDTDRVSLSKPSHEAPLPRRDPIAYSRETEREAREDHLEIGKRPASQPKPRDLRPTFSQARK